MTNVLMTGLTANSYARYARGPGKAYRNFTSYPDNPGTLLGVTKGGSEFGWGLEKYTIEPDGAMGDIKNHQLTAKCRPYLKINFFEWTANNLLWSIPGGDSADQTPTDVKGEYLGTGAEVTVGVVLGHGTTGGAVDEGTLQVWYTSVGLGDPTKGVLGTDYQVVDQITLSGITTGDTIVIGGLTFTGHVDTTTVANREFDASGDDTADAAELVTCINDATYGVPGVTATSALGVVTLTRATAGTPNTITQTGDHATMAYQVIQEIVAGSIADTDLVTASYTYDATDSDDAYTVVTPGQIATADYWDNVALVCELTNPNYANPYIAFIIKNCLPDPDTISIAGERGADIPFGVTFRGFFDPADGLTMAYAPVEVQIGIK
jgi:hypothetical protein